RAAADRSDERGVERPDHASGDAGRNPTGGGAVKRNLTRSWLVVLTLVIVLGGGFRLRGLQAQTQPARAASTAEAQQPDKSQQEKEVDENDTYRKSPSVGWLGRKLGIGTDHASSFA